MSLWLRTVLLAMLMALPFSTKAGEIVPQSIKQQWGPLHLTANPIYQIVSSDVIDEAINSGIVLSLIAKLQSHQSRDFWFDSTVEKYQHIYQVRYFSLSGQYQLHNTENDERDSFASLSALWRHLEQHIQFKLPINQLEKVNYLSAQLKLDAGALPSAMQLPVFLDSDWRFNSDWFESNLIKPQTAKRP